MSKNVFNDIVDWQIRVGHSLNEVIRAVEHFQGSIEQMSRSLMALQERVQALENKMQIRHGHYVRVNEIERRLREVEGLAKYKDLLEYHAIKLEAEIEFDRVKNQLNQ